MGNIDFIKFKDFDLRITNDTGEPDYKDSHNDNKFNHEDSGVLEEFLVGYRHTGAGDHVNEEFKIRLKDILSDNDIEKLRFHLEGGTLYYNINGIDYKDDEPFNSDEWEVICQIPTNNTTDNKFTFGIANNNGQDDNNVELLLKNNDTKIGKITINSSENTEDNTLQLKFTDEYNNEDSVKWDISQFAVTSDVNLQFDEEFNVIEFNTKKDGVTDYPKYGIRLLVNDDGSKSICVVKKEENYNTWEIIGESLTVTNGADGQGTPGNDGRGIQSITGPVVDGLENTYTINYTDGTSSTFTVTNGADGQGDSNTYKLQVAIPNTKVTWYDITSEASIPITLSDNDNYLTWSLVENNGTANNTTNIILNARINGDNLILTVNDGSNSDSITLALPTVPTNVSAFTNDIGYITSVDVQEAANIPTNVSAFTNDAGYITSSDVPAQVNADWNATSGNAQIMNKPNLATVATSGSYDDLTNKPNLFDGNYNNLTNKPTLFDGDYNSLTNTPAIPTVPTNVSAFTNDANYITSDDIPTQVNADWNAESGLAQILNKPTIPTIPTNISAFHNDSQYVTFSEYVDIKNPMYFSVKEKLTDAQLQYICNTNSNWYLYNDNKIQLSNDINNVVDNGIPNIDIQKPCNATVEYPFVYRFTSFSVGDIETRLCELYDQRISSSNGDFSLYRVCLIPKEYDTNTGLVTIVQDEHLQIVNRTYKYDFNTHTFSNQAGHLYAEGDVYDVIKDSSWVVDISPDSEDYTHVQQNLRYGIFGLIENNNGEPELKVYCIPDAGWLIGPDSGGEVSEIWFTLKIYHSKDN